MPEFPCSECGALVKIPESWIDPERPRSRRHHNKFFAVIAAAYYHWPAETIFHPESEEHLRAWLLCEAGHCEIVGQNLVDEVDVYRAADFAERLLAKVRAGGGYAFVDKSGRSSLIARIPKTINCRVVRQPEFNPISEKVFEIICAMCGVADVEELRRNAPEEAA